MAMMKRRTRMNRVAWRLRRGYAACVTRFLLLPLPVALFVCSFVFVLFAFPLPAPRVLPSAVLFLLY